MTSEAVAILYIIVAISVMVYFGIMHTRRKEKSPYYEDVLPLMIILMGVFWPLLIVICIVEKFPVVGVVVRKAIKSFVILTIAFMIFVVAAGWGHMTLPQMLVKAGIQ